MEGVARGERARDNILIYLLLCIFVTFPVCHLDTSLLNTDARKNTAREGVTRKKERNTARTTPQQKNHSKKNKNIFMYNRTCENCDQMKPESYRIQKFKNTKTEKAWPQRGSGSTLTACHICHRNRIPF